jgi:hypothetical protein
VVTRLHCRSHVRVANKCCENVVRFKYLRTELTNEHYSQEEVVLGGGWRRLAAAGGGLLTRRVPSKEL